MNSSISSSDQRGAGRFIGVFLAAALGIGLALAAMLILLDPYDTGRLTPLVKPGIPATGPRMANASRMRNPAFDAAILGNSTIQQINPERLGAQTGRTFVQLSVPGTGPMEQVAMIDQLMFRRGTAIKAVVLGLEHSWCDASRSLRTLHPFPFWLYDRSALNYAASLVRLDSLEFLPRRINLLRGKEKLGREDGYWNYEGPSSYHQIGKGELNTLPVPAPFRGQPAATDSLRRVLRSLPPETQLILVHPPVYALARSLAPDADRRYLATCKAEIARVAAERPGTVLIDLWTDSLENRSRQMFYDSNHYTTAMALLIEAQLAAALRRP
jgi:hypothetical protein